MNTLDKWRAEAAAIEFINGTIHPWTNAEDCNKINKRIIVLIDLVRNKDQALKNILQHNADFGSVNYINFQATEALALTEELK